MFQRIINEMPPHERYIEPFVGGGSIFKHKKPALESLVADIDPDVAARWSTIAASGEYAGLTVVHGDARSIIAALREGSDRRTLIYCDPPYVRSARRSERDLYRHEMTDTQHEGLLKLLDRLPCNVMLSGYNNPLYNVLLRPFDKDAKWRRIDFQTTTRGGPAVESLWCNFPKPRELHEYTHLGSDYRERERIKRKVSRWMMKIAKLSAQERNAILEALTAQQVLSSAIKSGDAGRRASPETAGGGNVKSRLANLDIFSDAGSPIAIPGERIPPP